MGGLQKIDEHLLSLVICEFEQKKSFLTGYCWLCAIDNMSIFGRTGRCHSDDFCLFNDFNVLLLAQTIETKALSLICVTCSFDLIFII